MNLAEAYISLYGDPAHFNKVVAGAEKSLDDSVKRMDRKGKVKLDLDAKGYTSGLKNASQQLDDFIQRNQRGIQTLNRVAIGMTGVGVATAGLGVSFFNAAAQYEAMKRSLTAVTGSADEAERQLKELKETAKLPGLGLPEVTRAVTSLQALEFGFEGANRIVKEFGNELVKFGQGRDTLDRIIVQLTQMVGKTSGFGQEIKIISEAMPSLRKYMKDVFGTVASEEIAALGISSREFIEGITEAMSKNERVAGGAANAVENLRDSYFMLAKELGTAILPAAQKTIDVISDAVEKTTAWAEAHPDLTKAITESGLALGGLVGAGGVVTLFGNQLVSIVANAPAAGRALADLTRILGSYSTAFGVGAGLAGAAAAAYIGMRNLNREIERQGQGQLADPQSALYRERQQTLEGMMLAAYQAGVSEKQLAQVMAATREQMGGDIRQPFDVLMTEAGIRKLQSGFDALAATIPESKRAMADASMTADRLAGRVLMLSQLNDALAESTADAVASLEKLPKSLDMLSFDKAEKVNAIYDKTLGGLRDYAAEYIAEEEARARDVIKLQDATYQERLDKVESHERLFAEIKERIWRESFYKEEQMMSKLERAAMRHRNSLERIWSGMTIPEGITIPQGIALPRGTEPQLHDISNTWAIRAEERITYFLADETERRKLILAQQFEELLLLADQYGKDKVELYEAYSRMLLDIDKQEKRSLIEQFNRFQRQFQNLANDLLSIYGFFNQPMRIDTGWADRIANASQELTDTALTEAEKRAQQELGIIADFQKSLLPETEQTKMELQADFEALTALYEKHGIDTLELEKWYQEAAADIDRQAKLEQYNRWLNFVNDIANAGESLWTVGKAVVSIFNKIASAMDGTVQTAANLASQLGSKATVGGPALGASIVKLGAGATIAASALLAVDEIFKQWEFHQKMQARMNDPSIPIAQRQASRSVTGAAQGGIFKRDQIIRIAEGNQAEAVVPLQNGRIPVDIRLPDVTYLPAGGRPGGGMYRSGGGNIRIGNINMTLSFPNAKPEEVSRVDFQREFKTKWLPAIREEIRQGSLSKMVM